MKKKVKNYQKGGIFLGKTKSDIPETESLPVHQAWGDGEVKG
jgi:hypothetical protein